MDTGWYNEATLFYNGYTYWCEGYFKQGIEKSMHFFVYKYEAKVIDKKYSAPLNETYETVFDIWGYDEDDVRERFLKAKIFGGKSFWEIEKEIAWYDEI